MSNYPISGVGLKGKLTNPPIPQLGASASKASRLEFVSIMSGKQENWLIEETTQFSATYMVILRSLPLLKILLLFSGRESPVLACWA